ncbi:hypothetical protein H0H92_015655 [Tricholoma furcatifolium]|nr:hypothetical protein H0H92_015655 [Tricholoma furcatifolium]
MPVSYVGAIKSVLETYPPSKGLLREVLQNSEDAKATKQVFVLDYRDTSDCTKPCTTDIVQSPALLAYNNASFNENDFKSIFTLWESSKKGDNSKIGKFGMGFRANFHVTDTPQVLSSVKVAILDPLNEHGQTDRLIDLDSQEVCEQVFEPFALGFFEDNITPRKTTKFKGTVVRLPLREAPSQISGEVFSLENIRKLLVDFIEEEIRIALLFLNNVASIEVHEMSVDGKTTCLAKSTIDRKPETKLEELLIDMDSASFVDLEETCSQQGRKIKSKHWRILRLSFGQQLVADRLSTRLGFDASLVLEEHKLRSDLAIAVELSILKKASSTIGRIFTYLPLPLFTKFCVHVHGLFALTPSREKLQNREETPAPGSDYHISIEWNKLLFEEYLPKAWVCLLRVLTDSKIKDVFLAWPPPQMSEQLGDSGYWEKLPESLAENLIKSRCRVWPLYGSPGEFCDIEAVLVAGHQESKKLLNALTAVGLRITQPPNFVVDILENNCLSVDFLSPHLVYTSLLEVTDALAADKFADKLSLVTDYLLSTNDLTYIVGLPVVPVGDRRIVLESCENSDIDHVLLESKEFALFGACDSNAISLEEVSPRFAKLLRDCGPAVLNVQVLSPEIALEYLQEILPSMDWVSDFWIWMEEWSCSQTLYSKIGDLDLLPTQEGIKPASYYLFDVEDVDPKYLSALKELRIPFLDPTFSQHARSALLGFKALSDIYDLAEFLDALDVVALSSFSPNEKIACQLVDYLTSCTFKKLNHNQRKKLRRLSIFPSFSPAGQVRIRIPDNCAVFGADLEDISLLPVLTHTVILGGSRSGMNLALLQALDPNIRGFLSDLDVLGLGVKNFDSQPFQIQRAYVAYMASNKSRIPSALIDTVGNTAFVVVSDGSKHCPVDLVDPRSSLAAIYEAEKKHFPQNNRDQKQLIMNLRTLDLMKATLSPQILAERINHITASQDQKCARKLIQLIFETKFELPEIDEVSEQWLPTSDGLLKPDNCRDDPDQAELFDRVLCPLGSGLRTDASFRAAFGWDQPVPVGVIIEQLSRILKDGESTVSYSAVLKITQELIARTLSGTEIQNLMDVVDGQEWVPVMGKRQLLVKTENAVFFDEYISAGFYPVAISGERSCNFFARMGCSERPAVGAILESLSLLADEIPSNHTAKKARRLLLLLPSTMPADDLGQVLVPDINYTLRPLQSVFFNDLGDRSILVNLDKDCCIAHAMIDEPLSRTLHMKRLGLKYVDLKPLGIDMGEQLTTTISNKLRSYTPRQILIEFVANASDAGATDFGICIDETDSKRQKLINKSLTEIISRPSIVLYNNTVFTDADFEGICRTGVGGKSSRQDTIGQFGFGALTMFHLTDFATIVSGESVLFLDPFKEHLPIRDRATLCLPLESVKRQDNMFGEAWNPSSVIREIVEPFKESAEEYLLFSNIHQLIVMHRSRVRRRETTEWRVSSERRGKKKDNEFTSVALDITVSDRKGSISSQTWTVVSTLAASPCELESRLREKYRLRYPVMLSLATRVAGEANDVTDTKAYNFFSTLPLSASFLPTHLTAPFILSDDRRQVRVDNLDPAASAYNRWLLESAFPPLYEFLLSTLLVEQGDNATWWPGNNEETDQLSELVIDGFYKALLKDSHRRVFLTDQGPRSAQQDVVIGEPEKYTALEKALRLMKLPFAHLPLPVIHSALDAGIRGLTPDYLRSFMETHPIDPAELSFDELHKLMIFLSHNGTASENLVGLHLLPLASGNYGVIESSENPTQTYVSPKKVYTLFPKSPRLVDLKFGIQPLASLLRTPGINVARFSSQSLTLLLADFMEERDVSTHDHNMTSWIDKFWEAYKELNADLADISTFPLIPTIRRGVFTSINNCENRSAVVLTNHNENALSNILSSLGLVVVERGSKSVPVYVSDIVLSGGAFPTRLSFEDLLSAMATAKDAIKRANKLDTDSQEVMSKWFLMHLVGTSAIPGHLVSFARKLPIWPVAEPDERTTYRCADKVKMLPRFVTADIPGRFMDQPCTTYSAAFKLLDGSVLTFEEVFRLLRLPQALPERYISAYQKLLTVFLRSDQIQSGLSFESLRVPNSNSVLLHPRDLYARDPFFLAAFEEAPDRFIFNTFSDMEHQLIILGMKRQSEINADVFATCARALHDASSSTNVDTERARVVFRVYSEELPLRIPPRRPDLWSMMNNIRFIPRDISRRKSPFPSGIDPAIYVKNLPVIVSPNELLLPQYESIAWTQRAHFLDPPAQGDRILIANPEFGCPSFHDVVEHLKILARRVARDFPSSHIVLNELEKTYLWLNDRCEGENGSEDDGNRPLVALHKEPLFLNVRDPSTDTWEWVAAEHLLLHERVDVGGYVALKAFLQPFEHLLWAAGAETVHHPQVPPSSKPPSDSEQLVSIRKKFSEMRKAKVLTDVVFIAGDNETEILPCHRTFLATYSSFFYDAFSNEMEDNLNVSVCNPKLVKVEEHSSRCVSCALGTIEDAFSEDLDLLIEILELSDFWQMSELHKKAQWLIGTKRLINIETYSRSRCPVFSYELKTDKIPVKEAAEQYQGKELLEMCSKWRKLNKRLV